MMKYDYPSLPEDYQTRLPQINFSELRLRWHHDYWDGALSGMMDYNDEPHWFQLIDEQGFDEKKVSIRQFILLKLSDEEYQEELRWHQLFREKVGRHTDYDEKNRRNIHALEPRDKWPEYYKAAKHRKPQDFTKNLVVGWFEWG